MNTIQLFSKGFFFFLLINVSLSSCATKKTAANETVNKVEESQEMVVIPDDVFEEEMVVEEPQPPSRTSPPPPPPPPPGVQAVFKVVEQMPRFPGCEDLMISEAAKKECATGKMLEFIYFNLNYPAIAKENGVEGTCVVTFLIERDGRINNVKLVRDIGAGCGAEAVRVVESMNTQGIVWIPGKQRGRPVTVQFNLPVKFVLPQDD